jgi:hypothetical protein
VLKKSGWGGWNPQQLIDVSPRLHKHFHALKLTLSGRAISGLDKSIRRNVLWWLIVVIVAGRVERRLQWWMGTAAERTCCDSIWWLHMTRMARH